jgi:hypothetical protein
MLVFSFAKKKKTWFYYFQKIKNETKLMVRKNTSFFFTLLIQHLFEDLFLWIFSITFMIPLA